MSGRLQLSARDLRNAERELCERSFADFVRLAWPHIETDEFVDNWHIDVLADHVQAVSEGEASTRWTGEPCTRLLINICPGAAKSIIISVMLPAWLWTRDPSKRVISTSFSEKNAIRDSVKCRRLIQSEWFRSHWKITLTDDQNAKASFENDRGGSREARAFTSLTGLRANVIIVDDPMSVDDAKSDSYRESIKQTFLEAVPTRLKNPDKDIIIVVMQRLHEEDITGVILDRPDLGYDHLCIPLFADGEPRKPTSIGWVDPRTEGENMFPARYTEKVVKSDKASLGPFAYAGQFQQRPVPAGDGFFVADWFHRYNRDELPKSLYLFMTSDHAQSGRGDYNVFRIWGVDQAKNLWLVDSFRKKCLMDEAIGVVRDPKTGRATLSTVGALPLIKKWKPLGWYPENDAAWGTMQSFVHSAMIETDTFCKVDPLPTKGSGDKMGKASAYRAMASMGLVHIPVGPMGDEALEEYVRFGPTCKHDDQVDADGAIARVIGSMMPLYEDPEAASAERDLYDDTGTLTASASCF